MMSSTFLIFRFCQRLMTAQFPGLRDFENCNTRVPLLWPPRVIDHDAVDGIAVDGIVCRMRLFEACCGASRSPSAFRTRRSVLRLRVLRGLRRSRDRHL